MNKCHHTFKLNNFDVTIQLPKSYYRQSKRVYPVLFVQDGDYLFKHIKSKDVIFVGILSEDRGRDFTPWKAQIGERNNQGKASDYLSWLTEDLFPFLRQRYRISIKREDIGIAGASFGGLVSLYALYTRSDFFGGFMLISPSLWYPNFLEYMQQHARISEQMSVYWYVGLQEGVKHTMRVKQMVPNSLEGSNTLQQSLVHPQSRFKFVTSRRGIHRKRYFKKYFKRGLKYLFK